MVPIDTVRTIHRHIYSTTGFFFFRRAIGGIFFSDHQNQTDRQHMRQKNTTLWVELTIESNALPVLPLLDVTYYDFFTIVLVAAVINRKKYHEHGYCITNDTTTKTPVIYLSYVWLCKIYIIRVCMYYIVRRVTAVLIGGWSRRRMTDSRCYTFSSFNPMVIYTKIGSTFS